MSQPKQFLNIIFITVLLSACTSMPSTQVSANNYPEQPRVLPIPVTEMNAQQKRLVGIVDGEPLPGRAKSSLFKTLMHHPDLFEVYGPMGDRVNKAPEIEDQQRELLILRLAWLYQGKYEWSQHYGKALEAGWSKEDLERVKIGSIAPGWSLKDQTLLSAGEQWVKYAGLDDDTWAALNEYYSTQEIMTLITLVTHYHWVAMISKTLGVQPDRTLEGFE